MMGSFNYKQRCYLLFGGLLLFIMLGYQFSFSDTFVLTKAISEKEEKLAWLKDKDMELPALKARITEFEKACLGTDSISVRDKLTAFISDFADNNECLVTEIPVNSSFKNDQLKVQTNTFTIKGSYKNLLTLINQLESEYRYVSKIMSARFYSIKDLQTKKKTLFLTIITQSFEPKLK